MKNKYKYLNSLKGTSKGLIGEILFKESKKNIFCTKLCTQNIIEKLPFRIPREIIEFLQANWYSIDCFEFKTKRQVNEELEYMGIILYEVKTQKYKSNQNKWVKKCKFTKNEIEVYKLARKIGIKVKIVRILFFENWKYGIFETEFDTEKNKYVICNGSKSFQKRSEVSINKENC